jgi:hypothetical protein
MKAKLYIISTLFFLSLISCTKVESGLKFNMAKPKNWVTIHSEKELYSYLYKDSAQEKIKESREINKNFRVLASYKKYKEIRPGINPNIQVRVHDNEAETFDDFLQTVIEDIKLYPKYLKGFEIVEQPIKTKLDNVDVVYFSGIHPMIIDSVELMARTKCYMIPNGYKRYQLTFNDSKEDDCTKTFDSLVKTIKLK